MKIKGSKRIPDSIREKVKIMAIEGHSEPYIAKTLNISNNAAHRIKKETDNLESLRENKKKKMANSLWDLAIEAKKEITKKKLKDSSAAKLVIVLATLIDKALLLVGDATERIGLTMPEIDQRLQQIQEQRKILKQAQQVITRKGKQLQKGKEDG